MAVAVAWYDSDLDVEHDVKTLARGGFDMTRVCVLGRDKVRPNEVAFTHTGLRARFFGAHGGLWTTLSGVLLGIALVCGPLGEHVVILGSAVYVMVPSLSGETPIAAALTRLVGHDAALACEQAITARKFLLIIQAGVSPLQRARELLPHAGLRTFDFS